MRPTKAPIEIINSINVTLGKISGGKAGNSQIEKSH
jgi:hypothetical protein